MFEFVVLCPARGAAPGLAIAATRAGALGVVDLQFTERPEAALGPARQLAELGHGRWGAAVHGAPILDALLAAELPGLDSVLLTDADGGELQRLIGAVHRSGHRAWVIATDVAAAIAAQAAGADGIVAKGSEAGGWIGDEGAFVLVQRILGAVALPVWMHGGVGVHTVAGAVAGGAAGAVLDAQVLLTRESPLAEAERRAIAAMDGSETTVLGADLGAPLRVYDRPGLPAVGRLRELERELASRPGAAATWRAQVTRSVGDGSIAGGLLTVGQDAAFAAGLARRGRTVAGVIAALREAAEEAGAALADGSPLAAGAPLARSHGTRYPIVQGPMTRVSDRAEFAAAVAQAGALPFLALALMRAAEANPLLARTAELLAGRPWGVGVLGFVPAALRAEQLEVVRRHRPPFALIAGGRPDQAQALEQDGITAYLHVPSPALLRLYLADGARRFVFEGRECGGHVGPRTSFVLWETMLDVLLDELPASDRDCHVLFAGGIHDARSAAMVAALSARAARRGIHPGALLGTAYLFTREAVESGAITAGFQNAAVDGAATVLLESGPGHATRCLPSPFAAHFAAEKRRLRHEGLGSEEVRGVLEQLNIGRLRVAAKGVDRVTDADGSRLAPVAADRQWEQGMYMIGEVAALHDAVTTLADLHHDISAGSAAMLGAQARRRPAARVAAPAPAAAEVAIVGVAAILPGAPDAETFWANILGKVDAVGEVPESRWDWHRMYDPDPAARDKVYSRWGGFIDAVEFDPIAFGLPPRSLASIEPFQLLALVTAQAALRDAGYATRPFDRERTSVILGAGGGGADLSVGYTVRSALPSLLNDPALQHDLNQRLPEWTEDSFAGLLMNVAAGRIANRLDLGGTNFTVDAACASSLAAISLATRELTAATSDMVLAGGVDAIQNPFAFLCFSKTRALSPRGRCRPFDASADGIAISEGFATVVLKRLADAERDGDRVYAVIRGVGAASDGRDRSLTAPRPEGQLRALRRAYDHAGVSPATVGLFEAHGTGTVAGDGAEVQALTTLLAEHDPAPESCAIGSVKSMIGHTKATAGVAGLIKAALALHHRVLPPTIGVTELHPTIAAPAAGGDSAGPLYVNSETRPWLSGGAAHPRRAGVSAFGFGGTDFHIVLEEYTGGYVDDDEPAVTRWPADLLLWRGEPAAIDAALAALARRLDGDDAPPPEELARELARTVAAPAHGRSALALVVQSSEDLRAKLDAARALIAGDDLRRHRRDGVHWVREPLAPEGRLAFLFPGQGSQTVDMGRDVAVAFPEARDRFEFADRLLADRYAGPLSRFVFPAPSFTPEHRRHRQAQLTDTHVAQAALGATELALSRVLAALGVEPEMTAGHSYGELVALAAAGAVDDAGLLILSEARGRLMAAAADGADGAMAAVDAAPEALAGVPGDVVAANLNAPSQTVLSGPREAIAEALRWCEEQGIAARALPVACAFHSPQVAGARAQFAEVLQAASISAPRIPVYSNTTADRHDPRPEAIVEVLGRHLAEPVDFVREIEAMYRDGARIFLEVGPRSVLSGLAGQILGERPHVTVPLDRPGAHGLVALTDALAALATEGVDVPVGRLYDRRRAPGTETPAAAARRRSELPPARRWLVDGGSARPLHPPEPTSPRHPAQEQPMVSTNSTNGAGAPVSVAAPVHPLPVTGSPSPAPAFPVPSTNGHRPPALSPPSPLAGTVAASAPPDRAAEVMGRYQQLMQSFLETQRDVMLGYLGAARHAGSPSAPLTPLAPLAPLAPPAAGAPAAATLSPPPAPAMTAAPQPGSAALVPAASPPAVPVAPPRPEVVLSLDDIEVRLLAVVSERTGYPPEMLTLDGDLEGDLGIDSIKRVEIAGTFTQDLEVHQRGQIDMEQLTSSRTLREVVAVIAAGLTGGPPPGPPPLSPPRDGAETRPFSPPPADTERVGRFLLAPASAPALPVAHLPLAPAGAVVVLGDGTGLGTAVAAALTGTRPAVLVAGAADLAGPEDAAALAADLRAEHGAIGAIVHLAPGGARYGAVEALWWMVQALAPDLHAAAAAGGAAVLGVTRLGGSFAVDGGGDQAGPGHGAVAGFLKTLALEWPDVAVKAVDLGPEADGAAAERVRAELGAGDGLVEVGYRDGVRTQLALHPAAPAGGSGDSGDSGDSGAPPIDADSVVLITGGARGITAQAALRLATHRPTLVILGRTPEEPESEDTAAFAELADLRRALIAARAADGDGGTPLTPARIEEECRTVLRGRELRSNLAALRATGARVDYRRCDVADPDALGAVIDAVYDRYGRIDGVVHGAGVIEDRLIADKDAGSVRRVLATKAGSALTLAARLRPESLRFLVLFSSVSGRFGNRGQADYAAASEVLNKLAQDLDRRWPARVVSINWGPWRSAGMVSAALEREFARRGVLLIEPEVGCELLVAELAAAGAGAAEVVIGAARGLSAAELMPRGATDTAATAAPAPAPAPSPTVPGAQAPLLSGATVTRAPAGGLRVIRGFAVERDRYLDDHRVDGRPVLPFAVAMELMAETAAAAAPGRRLDGLSEIRLLNGVTVPDTGELVLHAGAAVRPGEEDLDVVIAGAAGPRPHYRSRARLGSGRPTDPAPPADVAGLRPFPMTIADAYRDLLFHGPQFQRIVAIDGMDERGARARLRASRPRDGVAGTTGERWLLDPILLDSALQVQVLWARLEWDATLLPAEIAGYTRFDDAGEEEIITHELRIRDESAPPMCHADHWFLGADGRLIATLCDVVGVGSKALNRLSAVAS